MNTTFLSLLSLIGFVTALAVGWLLTVVSLPGTWLIVAAAAFHAWATPDGSRFDLSWELVGVLAVLAVVGEIVETVGGAAGVRKLGGSRRGAVLSIVGAILGAVLGTGAIPIPIVGTLVGSCVGAMIGAVVGETWKGTDVDRVQQIGWAAFRGRLFGSVVKIVVACVMVAVGLAGMLLR